MIFHLRIEGLIDDGVLMVADDASEQARQLAEEYQDMAVVLEKGWNDVTPLSFGDSSPRHRVEVLPNGAAVYGVYQGEEPMELRLFASEPGQKTQEISAESPILLITQKSGRMEALFVLGIIWYAPDDLSVELRPDLSLIGRN